MTSLILLVLLEIAGMATAMNIGIAFVGWVIHLAYHSK